VAATIPVQRIAMEKKIMISILPGMRCFIVAARPKKRM
jgi:hypothetical protein